MCYQSNTSPIAINKEIPNKKIYPFLAYGETFLEIEIIEMGKNFFN